MARTSRTGTGKEIERSTSAEQDRTKGERRVIREQFRYPDQLGIALPSLVLAIPVLSEDLCDDSDYRGYRFKPGRTWHLLAHQTAGVGCRQHYMHATVLTPLSDDIQRRMNALSKQWLHTDTGALGVSLDELSHYRSDLARLFGADCNTSYPDFEEGLFPIDSQFVGKLTGDPLPKDFDDLLEWKDGFQRACGCLNRFRLCIIGPNSD